MADYFTEDIDLDLPQCPHCGNQGAMDEVGRREIETFRRQGSGPFRNLKIEWRLELCRACKNVYLWEITTDTEREGCEGIRSLYPPNWVERYSDVPIKIRGQYAKALAVRRADPNAFVVILGRVLELVCQERGAQGNTLFERLQDLAQRGDIPAQIAEIAHRLRKLRNIGAHADLGELSEDEIPIVADLCEAVLSYVYVLPALLSKADQKLRALQQGK